jgi:ubiquinone/menaquinone biosynthesis C-methylase UbiE/glycosyltransferase involved in cell wall biosynthesis
MSTSADSRVPAAADLDPFKSAVRKHYDAQAAGRAEWLRRNGYYHGWLRRRMRELVPPGKSVLDLGCGTGDLLAAVQPARGLGIDLSPRMVEEARRRHPGLRFEVADAEELAPGELFDYAIASDLVGELGDISAVLERLHEVSREQTRLVLTFHNPALEAVLRGAQRLGLAMPPSRQNWLGPRDMANLLALSDYEVERQELGLLVPKAVPLLADWANRHLSAVPGLRYFNLVNVMVARPVRPRPQPRSLSCTVVVPCRNEIGNIEPAVDRMPEMGTHTEILFVDGASTDGTKQKIEEVMARHRARRDIKLLLQVPESEAYAGPADSADAPTVMLPLGKGDAVRKGFEAATGDVLMILDADLTVPPEDLPRFFNAIATGKGQFINGTRLVYPMEERAMKFVNYLGNKFFSTLFTWLLGQPIRDTLCGTKVLSRESYALIKAGRAHFGEFDPFGDFDLLFGAARQGLQIVEVPVRYRRRMSGVTKVRAFQHGWLLLAMSAIAFRKLKLPRMLGRTAR